MISDDDALNRFKRRGISPPQLLEYLRDRAHLGGRVRNKNLRLVPLQYQAKQLDQGRARFLAAAHQPGYVRRGDFQPARQFGVGPAGEGGEAFEFLFFGAHQ